MEADKRLVLRFEDGQFSFRHFDHAATDAQLYGLAHAINRFQEPELVRVVKISTQMF